MPRSAFLVVGVMAALYLLWLGTWIVFDTVVFGPSQHYWDQVIAAVLTASVALHGARRLARPYAAFLALQSLAFLAVAAAWATYLGPVEPAGSAGPGLPDPYASRLLPVSDAIYALGTFTLLCAWGYLALERWHAAPLSLLTTSVFALLMLGLGVIFARFYVQQYTGQLGTALGRLNAVTAALEFAVLASSLYGLLLRVPPTVAWMLVGTVILMAGDMAFSLSDVPSIVEPTWMLGQFMVLSALLLLACAPLQAGADGGAAPGEVDVSQERSGLSGILILVSLGSVLLSPLVWFLPVAAVWKSFFSSVFIVALVVVLVWITDRFDDMVAYLRGHVRRVLAERLQAQDWRRAPARVRAALASTGLGAFLDEFHESGARLKRQVLFLGPERLFGPPRDRSATRQASCFIVMPFGQPWSGDVHRVLAKACQAVEVRPVRGDDLFTPTDILEDIWQGINAADFVIADITGRNPNVLYELGLAHALAKPVLILSREQADIPIDLATRRVILYGQLHQDWHEDLERKITQALATIVRDYGLAVLPPPGRAPASPEQAAAAAARQDLRVQPGAGTAE